MMNALYMDDSYLKEFEAKVVSVTKGGEKKFFVVLDRTAFYPDSGGQPYDTGKMIKDGVEYPVVYVGKFSGKISHEVSKEGLKEGDVVKGVINWDRRYLLMRMHTAAHVLSGIIEKETGALITGNQLGLEHSRIDLNLENFDKEKLIEYVKISNDYINKDLPIRVSYMKREEALKDESLFKLANVLPPSVETIRLVDIVGLVKEADGGTHVKSTKEIGKIEFLKAENKGKDNRRVYFKLS
ncbi:MAG: alanyl-tRNA editing protein AlaX [Candidatus Aenigmarchaeota archaeon]|nr:alanyl-tRNA editing protein AlaX [Candidatus Aenigmarchaeota archaeon]